MKKLIPPALALIVLSGCASSYVKVLERKSPISPLTNILTVYVNEACNFSLADSTGYNICLRASFEDAENVVTRRKVEQSIAGYLATKGTAVFSAANLMGVNNSGHTPDNSYGSFKTLLGTLHVDGILVVKVRHLEKEYYTHDATTPGAPGYPAAPYTVETDNVTYDCYIVKPQDLNVPVWRAELDTKGASTRHDLSHGLTHALAKSLIDGGYIVH